jgi:dTDP-4-dehydrorhamnose reductase
MIHKTDRVAITGCGGMLGEAVYEVFNDICELHASDIDLNVPWLEKLDVSSAKDVAAYMEKLKPNYIVHLAAFTDMEYCELHPEEAYATNTGGVQNVAEYARDHNIPLLYISTAGIFDGKKDEYLESDIPNPLSVYGKSKYGGELVALTVNKSIVIRAGWMMGGGPKKDKKFINKIIKQLRAGAKEISVVHDKLGTPCHTYDLAQSIRYLLDNDAYGIYHGACEGGGSRADIARYLLECLGLQDKVKVREVGSDFFKESYFAIRPRSEKLLNVKLKSIAPHLTRDWKMCLEEYVDRFNWNLSDMNTSGMERTFFRNYFEIEKNHWLFQGRRALLSDMLLRFNTKKPGETKVLDFGCGSGLFVEELAQKGYNVHGLDISDEVIKLGQLRGVKNLGVADSHRINYPDNFFDVVVASEVLSHLEDEIWALEELYRVLKPGGVVISTVPAYMWLWGVQDEAAHHYRRYTVGSLLGQIKTSAQFEVVHSTYLNSLLFVPIAIVRVLSRLLHLKGRESDFDINNEWTNKLFATIFDYERRMLKSITFPFGVSALTVIKKPK